MREPIIVQNDVSCVVKLDDNDHFKVTVTIGLSDGGDFFLILNFSNLTIDEMKILAELAQRRSAIKIQSDFFAREDYNISHIVITKFAATINTMRWECLSDDPNF